MKSLLVGQNSMFFASHLIFRYGDEYYFIFRQELHDRTHVVAFPFTP